jgi:hypothetical protein
MGSPRLAQCLRCKAYTLLDTDGPVAVAVDVAPVDRDAYVASLVGRTLYDVTRVPGRPPRLRSRPRGTPSPSFDASGAQRGAESFVHREHGCGAGAKDQRPVSAATAGKDSRPATPGASRAGNPPRDALAAVASERAHPSRAPYASPRPSEQPVRCDACDRIIDQKQPFTGIHHGRWVWAEHEECP